MPDLLATPTTSAFASDPSSSAEGVCTLNGVEPTGPCANAATPCSIDRVALYDRALAGLRRHLLPLLQTDLHGVAERTGVPSETLRKRRRDLEQRARSLPGVDTLAAIAAAYDWSLDAMLDPDSDTLMRTTSPATQPRAAAPLLRAHLEHVVTSAVRRTKPWALDLVLGDDPNWLLERFEQDTIKRVHALIAEREQRQKLRCEEEWRVATARLAGVAVIEQLTRDDPSLAPWGELLVGRIAHAVAQGRWDFMEGRFVFPPVSVRATDSWELARGFFPAIMAIKSVIGSRIADALEVAFEVTTEEVDAARDALARPAGRGAGLRACTVDEVLDVYERFRIGRRMRPNAPVSLCVLDMRAAAGDKGPVHDTWALHDLFVAFCTHVGLVWHAETRHFTLGPAATGRFDERLAPHLRDSRMIIVPWGVQYWKPSAAQQPPARDG